MKKTSSTLLWIIDMISVLIFFGLCIQTAGLIFFSISHLIYPEESKDVIFGKDMAQLFSLSKIHFSILFSLTLLVSVFKASAFYFTINIFSTLNLVKPFSQEIAVLISRISYLILAVGILGTIAFRYSEWIGIKGFEVNELQAWWDDKYAYLLMGSILFVIAQVFKKGLELQSENDLTI